MSIRRLVGTALAMAIIGVLLARLGPTTATLLEALTRPQRVADSSCPDDVVLAWAAILAWAVWGWGVLGLGLTAATALPGLLGSVARWVLRGVLPAGARRAAAVALGLGLGAGIGVPAFAVPVPVGAVAASLP